MLCEDEDDDDQGDDDGGSGIATTPDTSMPDRRIKPDVDGYPVGTAQRNFTDPDSHLMKDGSGYSQAFNCQAAVDEEQRVIVAAGLSNQANDSPHLIPMLNAVVENCGAAPTTFTADAGYSSEENLRHCEAAGTDAYIPSARRKSAKEAEGATAPISESTVQTITQAMDAKIATEDGQAKYARRKFVGEAPFGNIKEARGFRQLLLRGIEQARHEWSLICTSHNLLKLFRAKTA